MRTRTLLLTASLGVVGAATALAQVYSINTVGYVNVTLKPGFNMVANPLDNKTSNKVGDLLGTALPEATTVYKFAAGAYQPSNSFEEGEWGNPTQELVPGEGCFLFLPGTADATVTFVGDVKEGDNMTVDLIKGFNMVSSLVPQAGALVADLGYGPPEEGDTVYQYNAGVGYKPSNAFEEGEWGGGDPQVAVAEAFWILKAQSSVPYDWMRSFHVQ